MNFKELFLRYGAYLVGLVLFFGLAYTYCFPYTKGKVIFASDNISATSAVQECVKYTEDTGDHSWWTGSMFSGMPNYQIGGGKYVSQDLIGPINNFFHKGHANIPWILIFYFACFFVLLRSFDIDRWLSIAGSIAMGLSSYFLIIIAAGHNGKTSTIALISLVFAGMNYIFRGKYGLGAILTMVFCCIGYTFHPQMAYYIFLMMGVCWIAYVSEGIKAKKIKDVAIKTALFAGAALIGFGSSASNIFANAEYSEQTMRGGHSEIVRESQSQNPTSQKGLDIEYATQWSYGVDETMSLMIPGFMGGANSQKLGKDSNLYKEMVSKGVPSKNARDFCKNVPMYWGKQPFTAGNVYCGAIVCFLFILGLFLVKGAIKWALLACTLLSIFLAWGNNFMWFTELFFKYFPLYNKFRAVSSILIVAEIAIPLLGFLAIKDIMTGKVDKETACRKILISGGITGGICLFFILFGNSLFSFTSLYDAQWSRQLPEWIYDGIVKERKILLRSDSLRSLLFICGGTATLWLYVKGYLKKALMIIILGVLCTSDLWTVDRRYFNDDNWTTKKSNENSFTMYKYEEELLKDPSHFRVFNVTTDSWNESRTSYYLKSIGGYSAAKLRRYQDLIDEHLSKGHMPVINMLNPKYFILKGENGNPEAVYNPEAMGNAWFIDSFKVVENATQESDALMQVDLHREAVIDKSFASKVANLSPGIPSDGNIILTKYSPKELFYAYSCSSPASVVFSEIYYPYGWKAYIDDAPAEHYRVNYMLRAMDVPAGQHKIHFVFDPDSVRKGDTIATVCILLMYAISLGIIARYVIMRIRKKKNEEN